MCVCGAAEAVGGGGPASQQSPSVLSTEGTRAQHLQQVLTRFIFSEGSDKTSNGRFLLRK